MVDACTGEIFLLYNSEICRLCGEENTNGYPLFQNSNEGSDLSELINSYLPLKITDDGKYPRWICPGCHLQVESTVQFFNLVLTGQENLRHMFDSQYQEHQKAGILFEIDTVDENVINCETALKENLNGNGHLYPENHGLVQKIALSPEKSKRKRGRPPKPPPESLIAHQNVIEREYCKEEKIVEEPVANVQTGRQKRRIKIPLRFQEAVQGKELEKVYMESGVIERCDIGSDVDDVIETMKDEFVYPEEVIGHLQDNEGVNLGDLVVKQIYKNAKKKTRFMCDICKICFCYEQKFLQHRFSHQNVRFECTYCLESFLERAALIQHQTVTDHKGEGIIEGFSMTSFYTNGINSNGAAVNSSSEAITIYETGLHSNSLEDAPSKIDLKISQRDSIDDYDNQFEDVFKKIDEIDEAEKVLHQLHEMKSTQQDRTIFEISESLMDLKDISAEKSDKAIKKENTVLSTESCELSLSQIQSEHIEADSSNKKKIYHCGICNRNFKRVQSYIYHRESEHNDGRRFVCSKCKKFFKNKTLLQRHQLVHSTLRPFACNSCNATFKTKTNLFYHVKSHTGEKKYQCNICEQFFVHKNSLTLHLRYHTGQKPFKCSVCGKAFSQYGNMQEHMRIHTGECPFECHICGRKFRTSSQCRMHVKRHEVDKPLKCTMCEKSFIQIAEFRTHQRRHNNIKPYSCDVCSKSFIDFSALKKHLRLHTGERPYACTECPRRFADQSNLKKHLKIHENKKRSNEMKTAAQTLNELTATAVGTQNLIIGDSGSNAVSDSTMWSLVGGDPRSDSTNTTSISQNNNMISNQLVYVTYQDPKNPIGNKTTLFVVNDANSTPSANHVHENQIKTELPVNEISSDGELLQHSNLFLSTSDNNRNEIQTVLFNIENQVDMHLDDSELFQSDETNCTVQLVTSDGQKMRLLNYADSLNIPD